MLEILKKVFLLKSFFRVEKSFLGDEPFGVFTDLRIYNYPIFERLIRKIHQRSGNNWSFGCV